MNMVPRPDGDRPELTLLGMAWGFAATLVITGCLYITLAVICAVGPDRW